MHARAQCDFGVRKPLVDAIGNGAVVIERSEYVLGRLKHVIDTLDIQIGFLLAGERGIRQVLCCGRGTHRERRIRVIHGEFGVGVANLFFQRWLERCGGNELAYHRAGFRQRSQVCDIDCDDGSIDFLGQPVVLQEIPKRRSGGRKSTRNAHPRLSELTDELAQ